MGRSNIAQAGNSSCIWSARMRKRYATVRTDSGGRALSLLSHSVFFLYKNEFLCLLRESTSTVLLNLLLTVILTSAHNPINSCGARTCHGSASRRPRLCTLPRTRSSFDPSVKKAIPLSVVQTACAVGLAASASSIATPPSGSTASTFRAKHSSCTLHIREKFRVNQGPSSLLAMPTYHCRHPWRCLGLRSREISAAAQLRM
jgi:hypothetical protein